MRQLSKRLHTAAAAYAADGEVCCFQLATLAQEFLQQHNSPPDEDGVEPAAPQSLWHEMLQRDMAAAAEREHSFRAPVMGDTFYDTLDGGLFSDAAELPSGGGAAAAAAGAAVPFVEVRSKGVRPPKPPAPAAAAPPEVAAAAPAAAAATSQPLPAAAATVAGEAGAEPHAGQVGAAPPVEPAALGTAGSGHVVSSKLGHDSMTSVGGGGGSMLKTLGHSFRAVLPRPLRKYLEGERHRRWGGAVLT